MLFVFAYHRRTKSPYHLLVLFLSLYSLTCKIYHSSCISLFMHLIFNSVYFLTFFFFLYGWNRSYYSDFHLKSLSKFFHLISLFVNLSFLKIALLINLSILLITKSFSLKTFFLNLFYFQTHKNTCINNITSLLAVVCGGFVVVVVIVCFVLF